VSAISSWTCYPVFKDRTTLLPCLPPTADSPARSSRGGGALPTAVRGFMSRPLVPAPLTPLQLQGGAHVAKLYRLVKLLRLESTS